MTDVSIAPSVTTGPIAGSTKIYRNGVPFRRVHLTNGEHLDLYDTSGPYTDCAAAIDLEALPHLWPLHQPECSRDQQLSSTAPENLVSPSPIILDLH